MQRYVLRFTGQGSAPAADLKRISATAGVSVIDTAPRMVLVEASGLAGGRLADLLDGWVCVPETTVPLPDPRRRAQPIDGAADRKSGTRRGASRGPSPRGGRGDRRGGRGKSRD
ncbi:MAG: hypothetical protein ACKOCW_15825 [Planctomycetaceae bacterium]